MRCKNCGIEMKPNAKFCHLCGEPDPSAGAPMPTRICDTCGSEMAREDVYCPNCGIKDGPEVQIVPVVHAEQKTDTRQPLGLAVLVIMAHTLLSVLGLVEHFVEGQYVFNHMQGGGEFVVAGVATIMMIPHWFLLGLGAIFSFVGWVARKPWGYLVASILQCVSVLVLIGVFISRPSYLITYGVLIICGFVSMSLLKKKGY
ncbi:MAG: zinc ribbon domain-containing protein [Clostridiales bacterium]|nr:zinc ribbon domain-containing protein [Clostridiales bacterium]